jgi:uncharacterized protein (DUF1697 family)
MAELKQCLEGLGLLGVSTYIASGNVIVKSNKQPGEIKAAVEAALPRQFKLDSELVKVLVLDRKQLQAVIANKPKGFGEQPETYHSDAIFLIDIKPDEALKVFDPREGVDQIWVGDGVIYSQRLSSLRTKSRLAKIIGTPAYQCMTIRNWNTTTKLLALIQAAEIAQ